MNARAFPERSSTSSRKFDRAVDVVDQRPPHQAYVCEIDGRLVTSADKYGTVVTAIDLKLDRDDTRCRQRPKADMSSSAPAVYAKDPEQTAFLNPTTDWPAPIANRPRDRSPGALSHRPNDAGESALGDTIADASWPRPAPTPMAVR